MISKICLLSVSMILVTSCNYSSLVEEPEIGAPTGDTLKPAVDTNAIETKILESYTETYSFFNDSTQQEDSAKHCNAFVGCKFNLNGDNWLDYFIIEDNGGGPTFGYFYDGETGNPFDNYFSESPIWSKPGVDIEHEIIDVACDDNQQELLIRYGSGGNMGAYYSCQIFRYDMPSGKVKLIFQETISAYEFEANDPSTGIVNYIDVNYQNDSCITEITVQAGEHLDKNLDYSLAIKPKKDAVVSLYHFSVKANIFVPLTNEDN